VLLWWPWLLGFLGEKARVEDNDVAPFDWPNFELLDHDTFQHMVGQI